jgi:hypothetical protein
VEVFSCSAAARIFVGLFTMLTGLLGEEGTW